MNKDFIKYANSFQAVAKLKLESITLLLKYLSDPQDDLKCIHIAGTNGKGSVCAFLSSMLKEAGYKTGKYISPNMIDVTERISIDGKDISSDEMNDIMSEIQIYAEKVKDELGEYPTQFELWTAAAFLYFKREKCDICVIEVGLGGERDATNVIKSPLYSIITSIGLEHTQLLGDTLGKIASAKAGIIKNNRPLITYKQSDEIMQSFEKACEKNHSEMILAEKAKNSIAKSGHEIIDYKELKGIELGISGAYQTENAVLALETALQMDLPEKAIYNGMKNARNMGRFEIISDDPVLIIDGAHNESGMASLMHSLERYYPDKTPVFIMAMMSDKEKSGVISEMKKSPSIPKRIYTVSVKNNSRAMDPESLAEVFKNGGFDSIPCSSVAEALEKTKNEDLRVICGSLYLYKDFNEIR